MIVTSLGLETKQKHGFHLKSSSGQNEEEKKNKNIAVLRKL